MFSMKEDTLLFEQMDQWIEKEENEKVKFILEHTIPTDLVSEDNVTMLHLAASHGNVEIMEYFINIGCEIDSEIDVQGNSPLSYALYYEQWAATKLLLGRNADIFMTNSDGDTPLSLLMLADTSDPEVLQMFCKRLQSTCADKNELVAKLIDYRCPLNKLIHLHDAEVTEIFLNTPDVDAFESNMEGCSVDIAIQTLDEENMRVLLHHGEYSAARRRDFTRCFKSVLSNNDLGSLLVDTSRVFIKQLVEWQLLNHDDKYFLAQIFQELPANYLRIMLDETLITYANSVLGYDIRISMFGNRNPSVLQMIKNGEVDMNILGTSDDTALHEATAYSAIETMEYLLDCGVSPNIRNKYGQTPLFDVHFAGPYSTPCLAMLLQCGADLQATDDEGHFCFDYKPRSWSGHPELRYDLMAIIVSHLAILEISGASVEESFRSCVLKMDGAPDYFRSCCLNLEKMKKLKVHSSLTIFETLTENMEGLIRRAKLLDHDLQESDDYYITFSRKRLHRAVAIRNLRKNAVTVLSENIEVLRPYYVVVKKICSFLSYNDLLVFAET